MMRSLEKISLVSIIIVVLIGVVPRLIFFSLTSGEAENRIGEILVLQFLSFLVILKYTYFELYINGIGIGHVIIVVILVLRSIYFVSHGHLLFTPELSALAFLGMIGLQYFFDMSIDLMLGMLAVLTPMIFIFFRKKRMTTKELLLPALLLVLAMCWLDWAEKIAIFLFFALSFALKYLIQRNVTSSYATLTVALIAIPLLQIFSAWLPSIKTFDKNRQFSPLPAMSFCESKAQNALFAVHPQCVMAMFSDRCLYGFIGVYDKETLSHQKDIQLFNKKYYGRPEQIICHNNQLFLGMNAVHLNGAVMGPNTMLIDLSDSKIRFQKNFAGPRIGNHILYDSVNDALFMTSEWDQRIYRWDFRQKIMNTAIGNALPNPWYWLPDRQMQSGSLISHHDAISAKRNAAYFAEWVGGRFIHELDLTTLKPRRRFRFNGGGSVGVTVDDAENKLWVSHLWGVSIFDLSTGRLVAKHRLGFVNRPAAIDTENNLIFIASTVRGRLHVLDRKTTQPLTTIPLGIGGRYLLVSPEMKRLYASSWSGAYSFDLSPGSKFVGDLPGRKGMH